MSHSAVYWESNAFLLANYMLLHILFEYVFEFESGLWLNLHLYNFPQFCCYCFLMYAKLRTWMVGFKETSCRGCNIDCNVFIDSALPSIVSFKCRFWRSFPFFRLISVASIVNFMMLRKYWEFQQRGGRRELEKETRKGIWQDNKQTQSSIHFRTSNDICFLICIIALL